MPEHAESPHGGPTSGIRSLAFDQPVLTATAVQQLESILRSERSALPVTLDCQALTEVTAAGLSALLELGRSASGLRELALTRLSRSLTLAAIQAGVAERFAIFASNEAAVEALSAGKTTT